MSRPAGPLTGDAWLLFVTRFIRLFAYGALSVVLVLYLVAIGINEANVGLLLTATLIGDTVVSLALSSRADRVGRRRVLILGALLMAAAGLVFASTHLWWLLLLAGIVGIISPSGHEVVRFSRSNRRRSPRWWTTADGPSLCVVRVDRFDRDRARLARRRDDRPDAPGTVDGPRRCLPIGRAPVRRTRRDPGAHLRPLVARPRTTAVPCVDRPVSWLCYPASIARARLCRSCPRSSPWTPSAAGSSCRASPRTGFISVRTRPRSPGPLFLGANLLAGCSALLASWLAARIGLINTMVATHLPSNILLILVPLMPTLPLAVVVLLLRFGISQMDVPARQSYVMAVVAPDERSAAAGITGVARTLGAAISPSSPARSSPGPSGWTFRSSSPEG